MRLLRRHAGAFGVGDAAVGREGRVLAALGQRGGLGDVDVPGVEQVEVHAGLGRGGHVLGVGQAGGRILGGEARDVVGGAHRLFERLEREVRGAGVATPLADVDRHAHRFVAVAFDVLDLALANGHRQPAAFGHLRRRVAGAGRLGDPEHVLDDLLELGRFEGKTLGFRDGHAHSLLCVVRGRQANTGEPRQLRDNPANHSDPREPFEPCPASPSTPPKARPTRSIPTSSTCPRASARWPLTASCRAATSSSSRCRICRSSARPSRRCRSIASTSSRSASACATPSTSCAAPSPSRASARQVQYIGKLMKFEDPEPLREAVASYRVGSASDTLALHQAEYWRDQLLAADDAPGQLGQGVSGHRRPADAQPRSRGPQGKARARRTPRPRVPRPCSR